MREALAGPMRLLLVLVALLTLPVLLPATAAAAPADDKITVGAFIYDVQQIDLENDSFAMDIYLWFRWRNPAIDPSDSIEAMNSNAWENTTTSSTGGVTGKPLYPAPIDMPDGSKYQVFRYQGVFSKKMNLEKYPFDIQNLRVVFEDEDQDIRNLEFVADATPVKISPLVTIPGYEIGEPSMAIMDHRYPTNFGDVSAPAEVTYSRIIITLPVTRDALPYLVKIILPILIVILITSLIYLLPARMEDARTGIGVTAMLTIVALQWTTDSDLPSVEYLMMLDLIYILSLGYILVAMGYTVLAARRNQREVAEAVTRQFDRTMGIASLTVWSVLMVLTVVLYLQHHHLDPTQ